jgi:hypothetical protein
MDKYFVAITVRSTRDIANDVISANTGTYEISDPARRFFTAFRDVCTLGGHPPNATAVIMYHEVKLP